MKNRIKICWLLLLTLLYTQCFALSASPAYARYHTTVTASALMEARESGMSSNCMVQKGQPSMTVLLGSLDKAKKTTFWLKSNGTDAAGDLLWSVSNPEHLQYVQISMQIDSVTIDPGETIELIRDVPMSFTMTISPTAVAKTTEHGEMKIHVLVTWGNEMWGTFQVILPEVKAETEKTAEGGNEDPEAVSNNENNPDTGNGESASSSISEAPATETMETESTEATEPTETTEVTEATEATEPTIPAPTVEPTEPQADTQENTTSVQMETLSRFDLEESLPVKISFGKDITHVRLGLQTTEGENVTLEPFPDYTMFSRDQGKSYYMMYSGAIAEFSGAESLLLDFSRTDLEPDDQLVLAMEAYYGSSLEKTCTAEITPDAQESCYSLVHPLQAKSRAVMFAAGDTREAAADNKAYGWPSRTLSRDNALEFTLPMEWLDAELEYSVEILTMTEEQTLAYQPVTLSKNGLYGTYMDYDLTHNLVFRVGEDLPPAGTYRLNMKWSYEGICFAETQTTFFINYSANTAQMLGG